MLFSTKNLPAEYLQVIEQINLLRDKLKYVTSDALHRWTALLARTSAARAMVGSNSIEGIDVTLEEAVAVVDGEPPASAEHEDALALNGYWNAMTYIVQLSKDQDYIHNEGTIKSLHYMMLSHDLTKHPGRWRPGAIHISNTVTNQIVYDGPPVELVAPLMEELIQFLNTKSLQPLIKAAMAHLNFTMIHPFSDGNGRMARAIQTMVLSREGILDPHFSSIEEYIGDHPAEYYAVLAEVGQGAWHPEREPLPWIRFCLNAHYHQAVSLLRRVVDIGKLWEALEREAKQRKFNERVVYALADAAMGYKVRNPTYRKQTDVSNQVAKYDLKNLADSGLLIPRGERRGRYYLAGEILQEIRKQTKTQKTGVDPFAEIEKQSNAAQAELPGFSSNK